MKMTKSEAFEYLKGKKMMVLDADQSLRVQEKLFQVGFVWPSSDVGGAQYLDEPFLFTDEDKNLGYVGKRDCEYFYNHPYEFIPPYKILELEIQEEKKEPQFEVGEWVLVRDDCKDRWKLALYAYHSYDEELDKYHTFGGEYFYECIPYEGNEHLLGTTKKP